MWSIFRTDHDADGIEVGSADLGVDFSVSKFRNRCFGDRGPVVTVVTQITEKRANTYLYLHKARTPTAQLFGEQ